MKRLAAVCGLVVVIAAGCVVPPPQPSASPPVPSALEALTDDGGARRPVPRVLARAARLRRHLHAGVNDLAINYPGQNSDSVVTIPGADDNGHVHVGEDELVTITVSMADGTAQSYYLRCLPHDFPQLTAERFDAGPASGWYLLDAGSQ